MTDSNLTYLDTSPVIYIIENNGEYYNRLVSAFEVWLSDGCRLVTSALTREEFCVHPYRNGRYDLVQMYDSFIEDLNIKTIAIDDKIADIAARFRGKYTSIKGMDALQLGASAYCGADMFLTNDTRLRQCAEQNVVLVSDL